MKLSEVTALTKEQTIEELKGLLKEHSGKLWTQQGWLKVMAEEISLLQSQLLRFPDSDKALPEVVDALGIIEDDLIDIADRAEFLGNKLARVHTNLSLEEARK